jgi:hypothetical protein
LRSGWGTMIKAGRLRVRYPMRWIYLILSAALGPGVYSTANLYQKQSITRLLRKADKFTAICELTVTGIALLSFYFTGAGILHVSIGSRFSKQNSCRISQQWGVVKVYFSRYCSAHFWRRMLIAYLQMAAECNARRTTVRSIIRETRRQRRTDGTFPLISAHQFLYMHTFITIQ